MSAERAATRESHEEPIDGARVGVEASTPPRGSHSAQRTSDFSARTETWRSRHSWRSWPRAYTLIMLSWSTIADGRDVIGAPTLTHPPHTTFVHGPSACGRCDRWSSVSFTSRPKTWRKPSESRTTAGRERKRPPSDVHAVKLAACVADGRCEMNL